LQQSLFLFIFVLIGALSVIYNKHNNIDYLVANYDIKSWLVALSAVATPNSGYMFIGMIG
jgi:sodium/proline symporter